MTTLPRAARYAATLSPPGMPQGVGEAEFADDGPRWSERHLQCVWFDDRLRPAPLAAVDGTPVTVLEPGRWNLEAGPDFLGATLETAGGVRLTGDVEVHVTPRDWDAHRHAANPLYRNLVAHVTYAADPPPVTLPADVLRLSLARALCGNPAFSFDDIDLTAYPHAVLPVTPRPCATALAAHPDRALTLLDAAGEFRIQAKARRLMARFRQNADRRQTLYEELLAALGYKQNAAPFRRLAQRLPVSDWDPDAGAANAYGRLLGAAGLLPPPDDSADPVLRPFVRGLWDYWWRHPVADPLPADAWVRHGLRPQNSPVRRLAAAAALFTGRHTILDRLATLPATPPQAWFRSAGLLFESCACWPFWDDRLTLSGPPTPGAGALLGPNRIAAMILNVIIPWFAAEDRLDPNILDQLPPEDLSAPVRATAFRLFGRDHNPALLYANNGLRIQGLLQIHADFCLSARAGCAGCPLAERLG